MVWFPLPLRAHAQSDSRRQPRLLAVECLESRALLTGSPPAVTDVHVGGNEWSSAVYDYMGAHGLGDHGYKIPVGPAQWGALPWSNLDQLTISFSRDVVVHANDLVLSSANLAQHSVVAFTYDPMTYAATWTLGETFETDIYHIELAGDTNGVDPIVDFEEGLALDGEWANGYGYGPSGNSIAGGDFEFSFVVMIGDTTQDGDVDYLDYYEAYWRNGANVTSPSYDPLKDIDGNGLHNAADLAIVGAHQWTSYPTGTPAAAISDAPTAGSSTVQVAGTTADAVFSLWDMFDDAEDDDNELTYEVVGNSNSELFDYIAFNNATGELSVNAATNATGRARLTIRATDTLGLWATATVFIDIDHSNCSPAVTFVPSNVSLTMWRFTGSIADQDDDVGAMYVEFAGPYSGRTAVLPDGTFDFHATITGSLFEEQLIQVFDAHGASASDAINLLLL